MSEYKEFKYGWPVVASSAMGIGLGMSPLPFYTIGLFIAPLAQEFGWTVDQILLALLFFSVAALFTSPLIGFITDKIGVRKMVLISVFTFSLSFMAFALNNGSQTLYLGLWIALALFGSGTLPITWTKAVNKWFVKKRGLALGFSLLGTGLFGAFAKQYASYFIENYGWRTAYIALALLPLLVALPLAFFLFRDTDDPKVQGKLAQMKAELPYLKDVKVENQVGHTLKEAFRDHRYWLLAFSFIPISFAIGGPIPNLETILDSKGFERVDAVNIATLIGIAVIVGRLLGGYLLDRIWAPAVTFVMFLIPIFACYIFMQPDITYAMAMLAVCLIGLSAGIEYDVMAFFVSKYFGIKNYSAIYGSLYGFFAVGAGFGPYIFGKSFAMTGSYSTIFGYAAAAFVIGAIPILFLGKYQYD